MAINIELKNVPFVLQLLYDQSGNVEKSSEDFCAIACALGGAGKI